MAISRKDQIVILALGLLAIGICAPFVFSSLTGAFETDWAQVAAFHELARDSLLNEGRFPLWTDRLGGGYPFFSHPECPAADPLFYLFLPVELWLSLKLKVVFFYFLALEGTYLLLRRRFGYGLWAALTSSILFSLGSYFPYQVSTGNIYIGTYATLPWFIFFLTGPRSSRVIAPALILAFILLSPTGLWVGAILLFLILWSLLGYILPRQDFPRIQLGILVIAIFCGTGAAAIRIFPLAQLVQKSPRQFFDYRQAASGSLSGEGLARSLLSPGPYLQGPQPAQFPVRPGLSLDKPWADSTIWLGPLGLVLAGAGLILNFRSRWRLLLLAIIFGALTMGRGSPFDIYRLLWHLPLFSSLHLPNKYFAPFLQFLLAILAGGGLQSLFVHQRWRPGLLILGCGAGISILPLAWRYHGQAFVSPAAVTHAQEKNQQIVTFWSLDPSPPTKRIPPYTQGCLTKDNITFCRILSISGQSVRYEDALINRYEPSFYPLIKEGFGLINWYGWLYLPEYAQPKYFRRLGKVDISGSRPIFYPSLERDFPNPQYQGEIWGKNPKKKPQILKRRPGRLILKSEVSGETAVLNLNWHPGWQARGGEIISSSGLLAFKFEDGQDGLGELFFLPIPFIIGGITSAFFLFLILLIWKKNKF